VTSNPCIGPTSESGPSDPVGTRELRSIDVTVEATNSGGVDTSTPSGASQPSAAETTTARVFQVDLAA
jgi:hypothetical protein